MRYTKHLAFLGLLCIFSLACAPTDAPPPVSLVLTGGHIIDVTDGTVLHQHDVWIDDETITAIVATGELEVPPGIMTIDVAGQYLLPGLVDAHVHLDHVDELPIYITQGVTTVFNLRGVPRHLRWRDAVKRGDLLGPSIYTSGDYMDGYPPTMQPMMSFDTPEAAAASVVRQKAAGYDMIKVYSKLSREQHRAIHAAAATSGLPVVGHTSPNVTLAEVVEAGQANIAHGQDLIRWYSDSEDDDSLDAIAEALRGTSTTVTPNLSWTDGLIRQAEDLDGLLAESVAEALPASVLQPFRRANNRYVRRGIDWVPDVKARFEKEKALVRKLHDAGVVLLAGTDASTAGVLPGAALHRELRLLVESGLTPLQAVQTATVHAGRFVAERIDGKERFGQLTENYRADIVVLKGNPLEDLSQIGQLVNGVVARGRWLGPDSLQRHLDTLSARSQVVSPKVIEIENAIKKGDLETARTLFDAARADDPEEILFSQYVPFFIGYGFLYGEDGFSDDPDSLSAAVTLYTMYAETYPEYHSAHYMLALALAASGDQAAAVERLDRALELHPEYPDARDQRETLTSNS